MDKIIDDLLGAPKITIFKGKQPLVRLQLDVFLRARGSMTSGAVLCLYHMLPHCGAPSGRQSHCRKVDFSFQDPQQNTCRCAFL